MFVGSPRAFEPNRFDNMRSFNADLMLDAGPACSSGRRSEAPGFGASDESAEDWSQADSQSPWGRHAQKRPALCGPFSWLSPHAPGVAVCGSEHTGSTTRVTVGGTSKLPLPWTINNSPPSTCTSTGTTKKPSSLPPNGRRRWNAFGAAWEPRSSLPDARSHSAILTPLVALSCWVCGQPIS